MILIYEATNQPVRMGDHVVSRVGGDDYAVVGWDPPHHLGSTGRVYVAPLPRSDRDSDRSFFPGVFNMRWANPELAVAGVAQQLNGPRDAGLIDRIVAELVAHGYHINDPQE